MKPKPLASNPKTKTYETKLSIANPEAKEWETKPKHTVANQKAIPV